MIVIELAKAVDTPFCVSNEDGVRIHGKIADAFDRDEPVKLSFSGVIRLTTAFLNAAVGQLYNEYDEGKIFRLLEPINATPYHLLKWKSSLGNAKIFFKNPDRHRAVVQEVLGGDV